MAGWLKAIAVVLSGKPSKKAAPVSRTPGYVPLESYTYEAPTGAPRKWGGGTGLNFLSSGKAKKAARDRRVGDMIDDYMQDNPNASLAELADYTGVQSRETVRRHIRENNSRSSDYNFSFVKSRKGR